MGEVLARIGRATHAAFVAIIPAGGGAGLHPQAQPEGRSEAEDGAARLFLYSQEWPRPFAVSGRIVRGRDASKKNRAAVAGLRRFRPDRLLEGRRAPIPAGTEP